MSLGFLDDALGYASAGAGIASLFGGSGGETHVPGFIKAAGKSNYQIGQMLMNPQDPRFLDLVGQEEGDIRSGVQGGLHELLITDQRARARGLSGLLEPERRDEGISSASATAFEQARNEARNRVRSYLLSAANVNATTFGYPIQQQQQQMFDPKLMGIAGAFDVARAGMQQQPLNGGGAPGTGATTNYIFGGQQGLGLPSFGGGRGY